MKTKLNKITADEIKAKIEAGDLDLVKHLQDVDIVASLPYVAVLYKTVNGRGTADKKTFTVPEELRELMTIETGGKKEMVWTYNAIEKLLTDKGYKGEDLQYMLDDFSRRLIDQIESWGFPFMSKYKIRIEQ